MPRNDFSNIPTELQNANSGKWVIFISKDYPEGAPMLTEIIASEVSLEKCYEADAVKKAIQQIIDTNSNDAIISHHFPKIPITQQL